MSQILVEENWGQNLKQNIRDQKKIFQTYTWPYLINLFFLKKI